MYRLFVLLGVIVLGFTPGIANGATALLVGGQGRYAELTDEQMATALGGYFAEYDRVNVRYPNVGDFGESIEVGADALYAAVYETSGPKIIGGVSRGAPVIDEVLRRLMDDPNPPAPQEFSAVIYGAPSERVFSLSGVPYRPLPETPYDVTVIKTEYDGTSDWPDNQANLLAVVNALLGAAQVHVDAAFYDISTVPSEYITTTHNSQGGTTTSILIPTPVLPLLKSLADNGASPKFIDFLDSILRPIIDSAYDRPRGNPAELDGSETERSLPAGVLAVDEPTWQFSAPELARRVDSSDTSDARPDTSDDDGYREQQTAVTGATSRIPTEEADDGGDVEETGDIEESDGEPKTPEVDVHRERRPSATKPQEAVKDVKDTMEPAASSADVEKPSDPDTERGRASTAER